MQLSLERQVATGFAVAIVTLLLIGFASWWALIRFESAFGAVDHTHRILTQLEQVLVQALNIQTGARGYALSGDPRFLGPFEHGVKSVRQHLDEARRELALDPEQLARLDRVDAASQQLIGLMERRNTLLRHGELAPAHAGEFLRTGKQTMDDLRARIETMMQHERAKLAHSNRATRRNAAFTRAAMLLAVAGTLALAAYAGSRVQREFAARQRADEALQRAHARFEALFEQGTDALIVADRHGVIRSVNRRTEDLFGRSRTELAGQPIESLMPARFRDRHFAHRDAYNQAPKFRAMGAGLELFALRADGSEFPVDIMLSPLEFEDGRAVLAAVRDITERKTAVAALQRSADEIRDLYNHAPCGYHSLDAEGVFTAINDTALAWLGYQREEVVGRLRFSDILAPASQAVFAENFPRFKATGRVENLEFELRRRDGSTFFVSLSASATFDAAGHYLQSRSTVHDITERRAAEQRLARLNAELQQHSAELEIANRELEAFSYSASHDLRAPLRHMAGFAALLEQHPGLKLDDTARRYLATITGAARKMGLLIDDLLAFSRVGRTPLKRARVHTDSLVRSIIAESIHDANPATQWRIAELPEVHGDLSLLRQVWLNLLANAAKYAGRAQPPLIEVRAATHAGETVFSVRDNGVGFDPRFADKLFQVFSRLHGEAEFPGTGIGLALVHRIVTRHGGRVWAEGAPGAGATFHFSLPRHPATPPPS